LNARSAKLSAQNEAFIGKKTNEKARSKSMSVGERPATRVDVGNYGTRHEAQGLSLGGYARTTEYNGPKKCAEHGRSMDLARQGCPDRCLPFGQGIVVAVRFRKATLTGIAYVMGPMVGYIRPSNPTTR